MEPEDGSRNIIALVLGVVLGVVSLVAAIFLAEMLTRSETLGIVVRNGLARQVTNPQTGQFVWQIHRCSCDSEATWEVAE